MTVVYKYVICSAVQGDSINRIKVPRYSKLLKVAMQNNQICAWYAVDTNFVGDENNMNTDIWYQIGTGHELPWSLSDSVARYVDTVVNDEAGLVWHMYIQPLSFNN